MERNVTSVNKQKTFFLILMLITCMLFIVCYNYTPVRQAVSTYWSKRSSPRRSSLDLPLHWVPSALDLGPTTTVTHRSNNWNYRKYVNFTESLLDKVYVATSSSAAINSPRKQKIYEKLGERGLESTDLHAFKSIYIQDPKIYDEDLTPKAPGVRKTKIISCFNCPKWYRGGVGSTASYNRDFKKCPYSECFFDEKGEMQKNASVVMFFPRPKTMPPRPRGQIWAHTCWEPPSYYTFARTVGEYRRWKGVFNWTFGYDQDHDFFFPNDVLAWRSKESLLSDEEYMSYAKNKTKTAVWWVSHCNVLSKRDKYVKEMQKYIDVDIYGKCGPKKCKDWGPCGAMFNDTYKFYLSFENSFCKDYVTPKFFRNFDGRTLIIPVARAGFNFEKHLPSSAYINAQNFKSAKELALFLKELAGDIPRYARLLKEKDRLVALKYKNDWCDFCEMLHTNIKTRIIPDVMKETHKKGVCWTPKNM